MRQRRDQEGGVVMGDLSSPISMLHTDNDRLQIASDVIKLKQGIQQQTANCIQPYCSYFLLM